MNAGLLQFFIFPGVLLAIPAGWLLIWGEQAVMARMQRRIGPPLFAPFFDFIKLLGKHTPAQCGMETCLLRLFPVLSVVSLMGALALMPIFPSIPGGFAADGVVLVFLLELPSLLLFLAGFVSGSMYSHPGSIRETILRFLYDLVFVLGFAALAVTQSSLRLSTLAGTSRNPGHWIGVFAILLCLPARLRLNPFSTAGAERTIHGGPMAEYAGSSLGFWELAHGLEWVALTLLVATLVAPVGGPWWLHALLLVAVSFGQVLALAALAAFTGRFTLERSIRFYWYWAMALMFMVVSAGFWMRVRL